jgi:hypothetical protein
MISIQVSTSRPDSNPSHAAQLAQVMNALYTLNTYQGMKTFPLARVETVVGHWRGNEENSLILTWGAGEVDNFTSIAAELAHRFGQDAVMVVVDPFGAVGNDMQAAGYIPATRVDVPTTGSKLRDYTELPTGERFTLALGNGPLWVNFVTSSDDPREN